MSGLLSGQEDVFSTDQASDTVTLLSSIPSPPARPGERVYPERTRREG